MFSMEDLSIPAKAEAMRYGYTVVIDSSDMAKFLEKTTPFLEDKEHFAIKPLSSLAGSVHLFSVRIVPTIKMMTGKKIDKPKIEESGPLPFGDIPEPPERDIDPDDPEFNF